MEIWYSHLLRTDKVKCRQTLQNLRHWMVLYLTISVAHESLVPDGRLRFRNWHFLASFRPLEIPSHVKQAVFLLKKMNFLPDFCNYASSCKLSHILRGARHHEKNPDECDVRHKIRVSNYWIVWTFELNKIFLQWHFSSSKIIDV